MAEKLSGKLILSKIPKELIQTDNNGNKYIWIDVVERRSVGQYGQTHSVTMWNKNEQDRTKSTVYLADLKPSTFGQSTAAPQTAQSVKPNGDTPDEDLPF